MPLDDPSARARAQGTHERTKDRSKSCDGLRNPRTTLAQRSFLAQHHQNKRRWQIYDRSEKQLPCCGIRPAKSKTRGEHGKECAKHEDSNTVAEYEFTGRPRKQAKWYEN